MPPPIRNCGGYKNAEMQQRQMIMIERLPDVIDEIKAELQALKTIII